MVKNLSMLTDFYEFTMANGFFESKMADKIACFDLFFRKVPDNGGFAIMAGLKQAIDYINDLHFSDEDIEYLKSKNIFSQEFLDYLKNFKFQCDVWAVPEGTPVFPKEPLVTVRGPIIQCILIETMLLLCINHQSLIATKANRIVRAAQDRAVLEFGARRAHGTDAAIYGARSAYIGGCAGTSCTLSDEEFSVPALGTMAHSWIQMFDSEYEAFCTYAKQYPNNCSLLVDTYNTIKSGVPNAIKCFDEVLSPMGYRPKSIRIDSGDITYLSKHARRMLDEAGYPDCKIIASNSLDEYIIRDVLLEGAKIDSFGVGERLITASSDAVFGGVYKLCAVMGDDGELIPKVKFSDNVGKITLPCFKRTWRLFDKQSGKAIADVITMHDERISEAEPYELFDPDHTWKRKTVTDFIVRKLSVPIFEKGKLIYNCPTAAEIRRYCKEQVETMWAEVQRFENPHKYYVDLSQKLWDEQHRLISEHIGR
ncbi:MAG: nicotinate phosphoribosyltransferase [Clostridia bacterium]|nr:nicotinate phosphoribosyltransferase [Clostridia bacterium]